MEWRAILVLVVLVVLTIPQVASLVLLVHRRKHQPLQYRGPAMLLLSGIAMLLAWLWFALFLLFEVGEAPHAAPDAHVHAPVTGTRQYFCGRYQWLLWLANSVIMLAYALRTFRVLKIYHDHFSNWQPSPAFHQAHLDRSISSSQAHVVPLVNPLLNHAHSFSRNSSFGGGVNTHSISVSSAAHLKKLDARIYSESYLFRILLACLLLLCGLKVGMDYSSYPIEYSGFGCNAHESWIGWIGVDGFELLFLFVAIYKMRAIRDDFGVSSELITVCGIWIICSLGLGIAIILHNTTRTFSSSALGYQAFLEFQASVWAVRNYAIFFTSITWPLIQSYLNAYPPLWSNCDALCSLETLLHDILCIQHFRNYLMSINRVEWILCWVELELFVDTDPNDQEAITQHARRIYEKYIQLGAELEVHLSPAVVHAVTRDVHIGEPNLHCFDAAQKEVMALMELEFPRFLASPSCEACLQELEREELLREILELSGMI